MHECVFGHVTHERGHFWEVTSLAGPHKIKGPFEDYDLVFRAKVQVEGLKVNGRGVVKLIT